MKDIEITTVANITYSGETYNTPVFIEYKHTGKMYFKKENHFTADKEIYDRWKQEGKRVFKKDGYYFINRIAIPTTLANGERGIWYITNEGDSYRINKVSKYGKKAHFELSNNRTSFLKQ